MALCLDCGVNEEANIGGICESCLKEPYDVDAALEAYMHDCKRLGNEPDQLVIDAIISEGEGQ